MDTDHWEDGPDPGSGCQTLLHRALDASDEVSACFLIRAGCDVNSPRRSNSASGSPADDERASPLHLCATWGLEKTAATLLEHGAEVIKRFYSF